ncbi:phosphatase PAP2 family protein [Candidatus Saccharibacteria bacterium]|nr:phosphatase PAP2 family protein [Candidatus Saccharibacteria bacterium]
MTKNKTNGLLSKSASIKLGVVSLIIGVVVFIVSYISMRQHILLDDLNQPVLDWAINHRNQFFVPIAKFVTNLAGPMSFILITTFVVGIWTVRKRETRRPFLLICSMFIAATTSTLMKLLVMDTRPEQANMIPSFEVDYSFPSGHTLSTAVFLLVIGYLIYSRNYSKNDFSYWTIIASAGTIAVAFTRLYLGYHWLTDVVASIGLGFIILGSIILVDRLLVPKLKQFKATSLNNVQ